jgi:ubiquinone/menaquinone biosynthesis C-methylase UbiE
MGTTVYHDAELAIALDRNHPAHCLPTLPFVCNRVLDVGCGRGQTLTALGVPYEKGFGVDLEIGDSPYQLTVASGESLPYPHAYFDFVICRVALPYMNTPKALAEMHRVLSNRGQLWLLLHDWKMTAKRFLRSLLHLRLKDCAYTAYIFFNGLLLYFNLSVPWLNGQHESFQTSSSIRLALHRAGFKHIEIKRGKFFEVTAR